MGGRLCGLVVWCAWRPVHRRCSRVFGVLRCQAGVVAIHDVCSFSSFRSLGLLFHVEICFFG